MFRQYTGTADAVFHVFDNIFVDIGDEQNIQESLSTFFFLILNIVQISKKVTANSLVTVLQETKKIVDTGYNRAKQILSDNVDKLHKVAGILLEKEKIEADEFEAIFGENA